MICFSVKYSFVKNGHEFVCQDLVDASSMKFAKNKLKRKRGVSRIHVLDSSVVGYY